MNNVRLSPALLSTVEVALLNRVRAGTFGNGFITIAETTNPATDPPRRIDIACKSTKREHRMALSRIGSLEALLRRCVDEAEGLTIVQQTETCKMPTTHPRTADAARSTSSRCNAANRLADRLPKAALHDIICRACGRWVRPTTRRSGNDLVVHWQCCCWWDERRRYENAAID